MKGTRADTRARETLSGDKSLALEIRASSIYQELIKEGCQPKDIISLSSHLISFVTTDLKLKE